MLGIFNHTAVYVQGGFKEGVVGRLEGEVFQKLSDEKSHYLYLTRNETLANKRLPILILRSFWMFTCGA